MKTVEADVLIVGGGIAGSALACALRESGYWVVLVEERKGRLDTARGDHLQPCTVDALARWGALNRFFERGAARRMGHEFRSETGETLLKVDYAELPIPHPYFLVFDHDLIAETFLDLACEGSNFELFRPAAAREFKVVDGRIRSLKIRANGEDVVIKPHIVVGADGSNSTVRATLGFETIEHAYRHPMVVLLGPRPPRLKPDNYFFRYSGPAGVLGIHQRMDGQIKITLPVGAEGIAWWQKSSQEDRACALGRRADILRGCQSTVAGFYPARMIRAVDNVSGNTVLVGDAAHTIHPGRGQGLNMGIANLQHFIDCLPGVAEVSSADKVRQALLRYQEQLRPLLDRVIHRHHQAATRMDVELGPGAESAAFLQGLSEKIRELEARPDWRRMHLLEVTGHPFGAPSQIEPDYLA
jgi:2-polyprenyl-6-methoxyphenol hydroxylase-like FAD-dependent oxidoreductase